MPTNKPLELTFINHGDQVLRRLRVQLIGAARESIELALDAL